MDSCLGHILESTKGIKIKLIDRLQREEVQCTRTITILCILLSYLPLTIFFIIVTYPGHLGKYKGIEIKLGIYIDVNERKYRRQEP